MRSSNTSAPSGTRPVQLPEAFFSDGIYETCAVESAAYDLHSRHASEHLPVPMSTRDSPKRSKRRPGGPAAPCLPPLRRAFLPAITTSTRGRTKPPWIHGSCISRAHGVDRAERLQCPHLAREWPGRRMTRTAPRLQLRRPRIPAWPADGETERHEAEYAHGHDTHGSAYGDTDGGRRPRRLFRRRRSTGCESDVPARVGAWSRHGRRQLSPICIRCQTADRRHPAAQATAEIPSSSAAFVESSDRTLAQAEATVRGSLVRPRDALVKAADAHAEKMHALVERAQGHDARGERARLPARRRRRPRRHARLPRRHRSSRSSSPSPSPTLCPLTVSLSDCASRHASRRSQVGVPAAPPLGPQADARLERRRAVAPRPGHAGQVLQVAPAQQPSCFAAASCRSRTLSEPAHSKGAAHALIAGWSVRAPQHARRPTLRPLTV